MTLIGIKRRVSDNEISLLRLDNETIQFLAHH